MGLASAYLWVLNTHRRTEQSPEPFGRSGTSQHEELKRSSLPWGTEQCPQQQQLPLEAGRGKLTLHSITLCSVPSNLREGWNIKCSQKKCFWHSSNWAGVIGVTSSIIILSWTPAVVENAVALPGSLVVPFLSWQWHVRESWDPTLNTELDLWRAIEKQLRETSVEQQVTSFPFTIFFPRVIFSSFSNRSELLSVQGCVCTLLLTLTGENRT